MHHLGGASLQQRPHEALQQLRQLRAMLVDPLTLTRASERELGGQLELCEKWWNLQVNISCSGRFGPIDVWYT
eukprot:CAMPEP_0204402886 /NCGR_PEP_ID=MMETSP0470-20130426/5549_1 /ASSEMBLY_ACC=CAM_ASM_000385 /TAXON_ID=2969 /ORGANISM="Oxyrrhis marina" /LENGTH=72 /DNA_ID=CAMNT_0051397983 /DNA_START=585 /DNA_END=803 /DNA_ORIENTATION=+